MQANLEDTVEDDDTLYQKFFINMLIEVDLTLPDPEHPKDLDTFRGFAGSSAGGFAGGFAGCVACTLDWVTG